MTYAVPIVKFNAHWALLSQLVYFYKGLSV